MSEKIKLADLIYEVRSRKLQPSQIFTRSELQEDPEFEKIIKSEADFEIWKRDQEVEEETNKQMDEEIKREEKLKEENELIPGYEGEKKKKEKENELIPGPEDEKEGSEDDSLIPD